VKTRKFSILFIVLVTVCLTTGIALANDDTTVFEPINQISALAAPTLTVTTSGTTAALFWTSVAGATGYTLSHAPYPYTGPDSIASTDMGNQMRISVNLWGGASFYVAVQAYNSAESSCYSDIVVISIPYTNSLGQTFVFIPAGTFMMGSPSDEPGRRGEESQHQVTLTQSFYMQTTEVTQAQWKVVMGSNPSSFPGRPTAPVEKVSWEDVQSYITQMNLRGEGTYSLPTEAQWEYAARAGSTTAFANGGIVELDCGYDPNLDAMGWYCYTFTDDGGPHLVAQKAPNAWGLYDMHGNVFEWCQDWYDEDYYLLGEMTDPTGPPSGPYRVRRGGGWNYFARRSRSANRNYTIPTYRYDFIGFRLLRQP